MNNMSTYPSEFTIEETINKIMAFSPVKIYYNGDCIWDDDLDVSVWKPLGEALINFYKENKYYKYYMITSINIITTDYHHSIIYLNGYTDVDKINEEEDE
jgi:phosphorylcholine metabolism protein LicD